MTGSLNSYVDLPGPSNHHDFQFPWNETKLSPRKNKNQKLTKSTLGEDSQAPNITRPPLKPVKKSTEPSEEVNTKLHPANKLVNKSSILKTSLKHVTGFVKQKIISLEELAYSNTIGETPNVRVEVEDKGHHVRACQKLENKNISKSNLKSNPTTTKASSNLPREYKKQDAESPFSLKKEKDALENKNPNNVSKKQNKSHSVQIPEETSKSDQNNSRPDGHKCCMRKENNSVEKKSEMNNINRPISSRKITEPNNSSNSKVQQPNHFNEHLLSILKRFKNIFVLDDSSSMANADNWKLANQVLSGLARVVTQFDQDGIELQFLHSKEHFKGLKSVTSIRKKLDLIQPIGDSTPTETKVEQILGPYIERLEILKAQNKPFPKPINLIIITDGIPDDLDSFITIIRNFSKKLDAGNFPLNQIGIQIVQIGSDRRLTRVLKYLDNNLQADHGVSRDIIDTTHFTGKFDQKFIMKCLLGGINRQFDRN